jgi:hypothetical protein
MAHVIGVAVAIGAAVADFSLTVAFTPVYITRVLVLA